LVTLPSGSLAVAVTVIVGFQAKAAPSASEVMFAVGGVLALTVILDSALVVVAPRSSVARAVSIDANGVPSLARMVSVQGDSPPVVTLTQPTNGATFTASATVNLIDAGFPVAISSPRRSSYIPLSFTAGATSITSKVALVRLGAVTHSVDMAATGQCQRRAAGPLHEQRVLCCCADGGRGGPEHHAA
jgi:hypothetical protein